jgi:Fe(3+) dicitrate transport protein
VADGQQGTIDGYAVWNVSASQRISRTGTRLFLSVRNVANELYIADRTRGIVPGSPRSVQLGVRQEF